MFSSSRGSTSSKGCARSAGLQRLPFDHYGKHLAGWFATHLASMHALLALPWAIKPIYGALSDNVPLFGSRRRVYLVAANGPAAAACLTLWLTFSEVGVMICLVLLSLGMALSSAVAGGVLVESGQRTGNANLFFHKQLGPLIVLSAVFTAGSALLIWLLPERAREREA